MGSADAIGNAGSGYLICIDPSPLRCEGGRMGIGEGKEGVFHSNKGQVIIYDLGGG